MQPRKNHNLSVIKNNFQVRKILKLFLLESSSIKLSIAYPVFCNLPVYPIIRESLVYNIFISAINSTPNI